MRSEALQSNATANGRRDRIVIAVSLAALAGLAWAYTAHQAAMMTNMDHASMRAPTWNRLDETLLFAMWSVMMIAMMAPAVGPMTVAFAAISRRRRERAAPYIATSIFVAGYLLAWAGQVQKLLTPAGLGRVQHPGHRDADRPASYRVARRHDEADFWASSCRTVCDRRPLSTVVPEEHLFDALPVDGGFHPFGMDGGRYRGSGDGVQAWPFLHRLLCAADAAPLRRCCVDS